MSQTIEPIQYLSLSAAAYSDLPVTQFYDTTTQQYRNWTIADLVVADQFDNYRTPDGSINPEFTALSSLGSWQLIGFQPNTSSGFAAMAFKNPATQEIVFAFRGTELGTGADRLADLDKAVTFDGVGMVLKNFGNHLKNILFIPQLYGMMRA